MNEIKRFGIPAYEDNNGEILFNPIYYDLYLMRTGFLDDTIMVGNIKKWGFYLQENINKLEEELKIINKKYSTDIHIDYESPIGKSIELDTSDTITSKEYTDLTDLMNKNNYYLEEFFSYNSDEFMCNIHFIYKAGNDDINENIKKIENTGDFNE
jgi:hypothetical protein